MKRQRGEGEVAVIFLIVVIVVFVIAGMLFGLPIWNKWRAGISGEADLARAESTKRILIETARAEKESAALRAEAIAIVGAASQKFPEYRQQEFIGAFAEALKEGRISHMIYVPTEANIPVMEANRGHRFQEKSSQ